MSCSYGSRNPCALITVCTASPSTSRVQVAGQRVATSAVRPRQTLSNASSNWPGPYALRGPADHWFAILPGPLVAPPVLWLPHGVACFSLAIDGTGHEIMQGLKPRHWVTLKAVRAWLVAQPLARARSAGSRGIP